MNIVLDEAFEEKDGGEKVAIGMVVRIYVFLKLVLLLYVANLANCAR